MTNLPFPGGDRELQLLATCLRPLADGERVAAIGGAASLPFAADRLVDLAHRHRVGGFVMRGLADAGVRLPDAAAARLAAETGAARLQALRCAGEEVRVGRALAAAGIDALFVKGATLATRLYGDLGLKASRDVDVLVSRDRLAAAGAVLADLGYRLAILDGVDDPIRVRRYLAAHKEAEWHHAERGTVVELHTELSDNRAAIPGIGLGSPRQMVAPMPGAPLPTLATAPLFAYLAYHGTGHLWARLKWLADVAALLHGSDVARLHGEAVALGAGRTPGVAILLAHDLVGLAVPDALLVALRGDRGTRRLMRSARAAIAAAQDDQGRLARPLAELLAYAWAQLWLVPGAAYRWGAVRRFLRQPYRASHLAVPAWAVPAMILGALPVRLLRRSARLRREDQAGGKVASKP